VPISTWPKPSAGGGPGAAVLVETRGQADGVGNFSRKPRLAGGARVQPVTRSIAAHSGRTRPSNASASTPAHGHAPDRAEKRRFDRVVVEPAHVARKMVREAGTFKRLQGEIG